MKDESVIPKGIYCHGDLTKDENGEYKNYYICPYWSVDKTKPEQENGYCSYLEKGDWDLNIEAEIVQVDTKTGEKGKVISKPGEETPFPWSLLWDQCKACNKF